MNKGWSATLPERLGEDGTFFGGVLLNTKQPINDALVFYVEFVNPGSLEKKSNQNKVNQSALSTLLSRIDRGGASREATSSKTLKKQNSKSIKITLVWVDTQEFPVKWLEESIKKRLKENVTITQKIFESNLDKIESFPEQDFYLLLHCTMTDRPDVSSNLISEFAKRTPGKLVKNSFVNSD